MRRPTDRSQGKSDQQKPVASAVSGAAFEGAPSAEGIDITRKAPGTARIVEPVHNLRRSFGLEAGSALATVPSMIDDNELASQTIVDESEVFDDPFYEALLAVEPDGTEEPAESPADSDAPKSAEAASDEPAAEESHAAFDSASVTDEAAMSLSADEESAKEHETAAPMQNAGEDTAPKSSEADAPEQPARSPEPKFGLKYGSALAMVPSMIDDNLLCSELVVDEAEVFDDPFFEALLAVESDDGKPLEDPSIHDESAVTAEDAPVEAEAKGTAEAQPTENPEPEPVPEPKPEPRFGLEYGSALAMVPSMIDDNMLCSELVVDEAEVFDDPFFEALLAVEDAVESSETLQETEADSQAESDEATNGLLYTTASALVEEDEEDEEPPRGKHARIAEEPAYEPEPETEPEPEPEPETGSETRVKSELSAAAEPELELSLEPKPEAANAPAEEGANESVESETPEIAAVDESTPEESAGDEGTRNASTVEEEARPRVDSDHAATEAPQPSPAEETATEKLPDDESVADAVDAMVVDADPDEGKAPTPVAEAPAKRGFWSRLKDLFRRKK